MDLNPNLSSFKETRWLQWVVATGSMLMMLVVGLGIGWSSPYLAQFLSGKSEFPVTEDEVSMMASLFQLGRLPGAILATICVRYFGSKAVMIGNGFGLIISWVLVIVANSAAWIYANRFICGASIEIASISFPSFLGDVSSSNIRGALVTFTMNGLSLGILMGNVMGPYISMKIFAFISLIPTACFVLIFISIPQSPYFLVNKNKTREAEKSLLSYNPKTDARQEIEIIKKFVSISNSITFVDQLREFNIPQNRKSGLIVITLYLFSQFSGLNPLAAYTETIATRGMVTAIPVATVPILSNGLGILSGWLTIYLSEKLGRRIIWISSSAGVCISMTMLGTHFYFLSQNFDSDSLQWLPIFSLITFHVLYNVGLNCVPAILLSELFSSNIRVIAASICCGTAAIFAYLSIISYQQMLLIMNEGFIYWSFAGLMFLSFIFGFVLVPEMKGKTLLEIQNIIRTDKRKIDSTDELYV